MTGTILDQARRLDRAERRWLDDARARLRRTTEGPVAADRKPEGDR